MCAQSEMHTDLGITMPLSKVRHWQAHVRQHVSLGGALKYSIRGQPPKRIIEQDPEVAVGVLENLVRNHPKTEVDLCPMPPNPQPAPTARPWIHVVHHNGLQYWKPYTGDAGVLQEEIGSQRLKFSPCTNARSQADWMVSAAHDAPINGVATTLYGTEKEGFFRKGVVVAYYG